MRGVIAMVVKLNDDLWKHTRLDAFRAQEGFWVWARAVTTRSTSAAQGAFGDVDSITDRESWKTACHSCNVEDSWRCPDSSGLLELGV